MCVFRRSRPAPVVSTPAPVQPRQPDLVAASQLPSKKELVDEDDLADVDYGTAATKKDDRLADKRTGTDALKILVNTGTGGAGSGSGGVNV